MKIDPRPGFSGFAVGSARRMPSHFLPGSPFLQLVPNRVEAALRRLRERLWSGRTAVAVYGAIPTIEHRTLSEVRAEPLRAVAVGSSWGRQFDQRWFRLELPRLIQGPGERYLEWRDQGEATLHIGDRPYYGFDIAHRYVALPAEVETAWIEAYCCQTAIWHPEATGLSSAGSTFEGAFLVQRDETIWAALHDLQCLFDLMMHLRAKETPAPPAELLRFGQQPNVERASPVYRILLSRLSAAIDALDTHGVEALRQALVPVYREFRETNPWLRATLTGHSHLDLVWLWPERIGEAKAVHTFATMDRLMSLYPEFRFAYSQPASYRAVERRAPPLAAAIADRVRSGQWEPTGVLDVESDTLLPCGEALARSFLLGQAEFRRLRGVSARVLWLPDVFGYSGCLPQLMRLTGVTGFFTTKLTWSAINRFPYSSFVWRGTDGSEVVAHVTQNVGYNNRLDLTELHDNAAGHVQADVHPEFLHPTGYGDGGGGVTEEMCERARRLSALADGPELTWDQPEAFFARLEPRRDQLPVYQGECYLEYHRGTYTTHGELKAAFRELERALQAREAAAVALGAMPDLTAAWRRLVFAQFHDYIPGSSIAEVYAEGVPELGQLAREQFSAASEALAASAATKTNATWQAFNPLPQAWSGWLRSKQGQPRWVELPPLTSCPIALAQPPPAAVRLHGQTLSNGQVEAEVGSDGSLARLTFAGRKIEFTSRAACAVLYPDFPAQYDAWDIDRHTLALGRPVDTPAQVRVTTQGGDCGVIEVTRRLGNASELTLRYRLEAGEAFLRIEAEVDWREENTLLKLHFPTAYRGTNARFGAPFGSVLRSQQPGRSTDEAQWEVPGSRWAAVASDGEREGLALVTEAKYGFLARDGDLSVSLLRSARVTGQGGDRYAVPEGLSRAAPVSPYSDQGRHLIRLALAPYDLVGEQGALPAVLADLVFSEPILYRGEPVEAGFLGMDHAPTLVAAWAIPAAQDGWLLRLHEVSGQRGEFRLRVAPEVTVQRCGFDGSLPTEHPAADGLYPFKPYEIITMKLARRR